MTAPRMSFAPSATSYTSTSLKILKQRIISISPTASSSSSGLTGIATPVTVYVPYPGGPTYTYISGSATWDTYTQSTTTSAPTSASSSTPYYEGDLLGSRFLFWFNLVFFGAVLFIIIVLSITLCGCMQTNPPWDRLKIFSSRRHFHDASKQRDKSRRSRDVELGQVGSPSGRNTPIGNASQNKGYQGHIPRNRVPGSQCDAISPITEVTEPSSFQSTPARRQFAAGLPTPTLSPSSGPVDTGKEKASKSSVKELLNNITTRVSHVRIPRVHRTVTQPVLSDNNRDTDSTNSEELGPVFAAGFGSVNPKRAGHVFQNPPDKTELGADGGDIGYLPVTPPGLFHVGGNTSSSSSSPTISSLCEQHARSAVYSIAGDIKKVAIRVSMDDENKENMMPTRAVIEQETLELDPKPLPLQVLPQVLDKGGYENRSYSKADRSAYGSHTSRSGVRFAV